MMLEIYVGMFVYVCVFLFERGTMWFYKLCFQHGCFSFVLL